MNKEKKKEFYKKLSKLEKRIAYRFRNKKFIISSLTHRSFINQGPDFYLANHENNERLEFLGDSVLGLITSKYLYDEFPELSEGELSELRSNLVCKKSLAEIARRIELYDYMILGKGITIPEIKENDSVLENTVEALIGALYLDGGLKEAIKFIKTYLVNDKEEVKKRLMKDSKTQLQELLQAEGDAKIEYVVTKEEGPDHDKTFEVEVYNKGVMLGTGVGKSKKIAEQEAAQKALLSLEV